MVYSSYFGDDCSVWEWVDAHVPDTGLVLDDQRQLVYWYKGSIDPSGESNWPAILRAVKAWRKFEKSTKPEGVWCNPARTELAQFYKRVFPHIPQHPPWMNVTEEETPLTDEELAKLLFG